MDIFETQTQKQQQQQQQQREDDLILFNQTSSSSSLNNQANNGLTTATTTTTNNNPFLNNNNNITSNQTSTPTASYYNNSSNSGRSTPNTISNNRVNKMTTNNNQQQLLTTIDDDLFDTDLFSFKQQQPQMMMPKHHQQQLQFLNDEIQNRLMFSSTLNDQQQQQQSMPMSNSYRSLSLNNVILQQSPTRQVNNNLESFILRQSLTTPAQYNVNTNNSNYRRERSLDRSISSNLLTHQQQQQQQQPSSNNKQRSYSVNKSPNNINRVTNGGGGGLEDQNLFKHDLSSNSIHKLLLQQQVSSNQNSKSKEIQMKLIEMQKEIISLKSELEITNQKLQSSIHSVKTFWSPELKKERQARKEETAKYQNLFEKYKILISSNNFTNGTAPDLSSSSTVGTSCDEQSPIFNLNKLMKENNLLKKTISELEMRINTQKQVVGSKDETIKNLFMLINSKEAQQQQQHVNEMNSSMEISELKVDSRRHSCFKII